MFYKMSAKVFLLSTLIFSVTNAAVLLWSKEKLEIPALSIFSDENLETLVRKLNYPEVIIYKTSPVLLPEFQKLITGYHSAYNPNGEINTENATEITTEDDLTLLDSKQTSDSSRDVKMLSVLVISGRFKREALISSTTEGAIVAPKGPVLYRGKSNRNIYSMLYSTKPLVLKNANSMSNSTIELGESVLVTVDKQNKNTTTRLDASIRVNEDKIILQFSFTWQNTYWSLNNVRVKSTMANFSINLTITEAFFVPARFSYHCSGVTVFSDADKTTELLIYDLQVQPDSKDGMFDDVYDCVDFTTVPIWSGLLISGLLGGGLIIALIAISEIKTMDKFDTQKTKQLAVTVAE